MRSPSTRRRAVVPIVAAAVALCGCGGNEEPAASEPPTTTTPSTTPSSTLSSEAQDERALRQLAEDWFEAVRQILIGSRPLEDATDFLSRSYLRMFSEQVNQLEEAGQVVRLDPEARSRQETTEVILNGDSAEIIECVVDGDHLLSSDGELLNDEVTARLVRTQAERVDDGWRFNERIGLTEERGSTTCSDVQP